MQSAATSVYLKYRRLLLLLLIFPTYKLIQALFQSDAGTVLIMGVILCFALVSISFLEWKVRKNAALEKKQN